MINTYLVRNPFVFSWKKFENTKMAAVIPDIFWHLVKGLSEVNNTAVSVPPVDKITYDAVLVAFTNEIIKDNNFWLSTGSSSSRMISSPRASMTS